MKPTILLVDDSETMRQVLRVYLMGKDFDFLEAADGERALRILATTKVSVVVADLNMPRVDGIEFVHLVRQRDRPGQRVPIVLVTGDKSDRRDLARTEDIDGFLTKPVDGARLADLVDKLVSTAAR